MQANLSTVKSIINAKVTEYFFCFICNDKKRDKIPSEITHPFGKKTFVTIFFQHPGLLFIPETIIAILLKLV